MTFPLIIIGIIFSGSLALVALVFAIISLAKGKNNTALMWAGGFVIALALVMFSFFQFAHRLVNKVEDRMSSDAQHEDRNIDSQKKSDVAFQQQQRQEWIDTLKLHVNDQYDGSVPPDFYANKPPAASHGDSIITLPFLYPHCIRYNIKAQTGDIFVNTNDSTFVKNVSAMAFDQNFAIIKINNSRSLAELKANHAEIEYVLYDLRTRNFEPAENKEKLMDLARRIGYTGPTEMKTLEMDYSGWITYE